ncbi:MAG: hypothetical protein IPP07_28755 [Holophagales bacterium]|jgi:hypothetical protein|nr:hypothetical protein [Holophagales bacterium]
MALPTVADVNAQVRSIVGDPTTDYLTDAILLPYVQRAYRKAARVLRAAGMRLLVKDCTPIAVLTTTSQLDRSGAGILYPADLLRPLVLREKPTASTAYSQMSQQQEPPYDKTAASLRETWDWRADSIFFPQSSSAGTIAIRYEADLPALTGNGSEILILDAVDAVALLAAAYTAQARDETQTSALFKAEAMEDLGLIAASETGIKAARAASFGRQ